MNDIYEILQEIGFSVNEAKVYVALVSKNPMSGYEIAKRSNVTRTMVYDILNRLVKKEIVQIIENDPKLYVPVPYKDLFQKFKEEYNSRLEIMEKAFDTIEPEQKSDVYIKNITDYDAMVMEIRNLIGSAKNEIYLSIWEEEAKLFIDDIHEVFKKGVNIITFSFGKIPFDFGISYTYKIPSKELNKIWNRRRIIVVVDRERILIGEGNEKIEEISLITSNTMLVEMAIDQILLDILHMHELKRGNFLPQKITSIDQYKSAVRKFHDLLKIDISKLPKRVDQD